MSVASALAEWRRAQASLGATDSCRRDRYYADAVSRAYYAVLHAARAALEYHGFTTVTHSATKNTFGLHIVRAGRIEPQWGSVIGDMADARRDADYKAALTFDETDADAAYAQSAEFLNRIRELLAGAVLNAELQ